MKNKEQREERYEEIWRREASGISIKDACAEKGIKPDTYYQWKRRQGASAAPKIVHHDAGVSAKEERYLRHKDNKIDELFLFIEFLEAQIKMYKKMRGL